MSPSQEHSDISRALLPAAFSPPAASEPPCPAPSFPPSALTELQESARRRGEYTLRYIIGLQLKLPNATSTDGLTSSATDDRLTGLLHDVSKKSGRAAAAAAVATAGRARRYDDVSVDNESESSSVAYENSGPDKDVQEDKDLLGDEFKTVKKVKRGPKYCINDCLSQEMSFVRCRYVCN